MAYGSNPELEAGEELQSILIARATGQMTDEARYKQLRKWVLDTPRLEGYVPKVVGMCRDFAQFWAFIQPKFPTYHERRTYLWGEFARLIDLLEQSTSAKADSAIGDGLVYLSGPEVQKAWDRALDRRAKDPAGAITAARTLLETVCKRILDECGVAYNGTEDLPKLYKMVADQLAIAPNKQLENTFNQIFGGATSVVQGIGALRNKLGDAHGTGAGATQVDPLHAELAVNLSGSIATYLVQSWARGQQ